MSGTPDLPENYKVHTYELAPIDENTTQLTLSQQNVFDTEDKLSKAWNHWDVVINGMKKLLESQ